MANFKAVNNFGDNFVDFLAQHFFQDYIKDRYIL
jgi:hypothetical protein